MNDVHARTIGISEEVFSNILPRIEDIAELKLVLQVAYRAAVTESDTVPLEDLLEPRRIHNILGALSPEPVEDRLRRVIDRAVANGTILRVDVRLGGKGHEYLIVPTAEGRELLQQIRAGEIVPTTNVDAGANAEVLLYPPNVYALYEQHIGPLTPLVAEHLRDVERLYPREWVEQAILTAVHYNRRNWRYIEAILSRREGTEGLHGISE